MTDTDNNDAAFGPMQDTKLDALVRTHFEREATSAAGTQRPSDFDTHFQAAAQQIHNPASAAAPMVRLLPLDKRFGMGLAATLLLATGIFVGLQDRSPNATKESPGWLAENMQARLTVTITTTTLWQAPSDQFLRQTQPLAGWRLPAGESLKFEELL